MKTLYINRHAKSEHNSGVEDHKRPLNERGNEDASELSSHIASKFSKPDLIISSDAKRALTTANYFKDAFEIADKDFMTDRDLYDFSGESALHVIREAPDSAQTLMIFGHNNAFTYLANKLGDKYIENLPTCGFVAIEFKESSWTDITKGKTKATVFPKDLQ